MPGLLSQLQPDSIAEFERAANERFEEAMLLMCGPRWFISVYMFGYAIEMWLKAGFFHNEGLIGVNDPITTADLRRAWSYRIPATLGPPFIGNNVSFHEIRVWARLLVHIRGAAGVLPPYPPAIAMLVETLADQVRQHWGPELRYHHEIVDRVDLGEVRTAAEWFQENYPSL